MAKVQFNCRLDEEVAKWIADESKRRSVDGKKFGNNILDESTRQADDSDRLGKVVREIFEILSAPYWEDQAAEIGALIEEYCKKV